MAEPNGGKHERLGELDPRSERLPAMLTAREASALLRIRPPQVYMLARDGILPSVRIGRSVRFNRERLLAWIEAGGAGLQEVRK